MGSIIVLVCVCKKIFRAFASVIKQDKYEVKEKNIGGPFPLLC